jgi:hypothetical protein
MIKHLPKHTQHHPPKPGPNTHTKLDPKAIPKTPQVLPHNTSKTHSMPQCKAFTHCQFHTLPISRIPMYQGKAFTRSRGINAKHSRIPLDPSPEQSQVLPSKHPNTDTQNRPRSHHTHCCRHPKHTKAYPLHYQRGLPCITNADPVPKHKETYISAPCAGPLALPMQTPLQWSGGVTFNIKNKNFQGGKL